MANERRRLDDLKLMRATEGLDGESAAELARLLASSPEGDDRNYERAAAAICLAVLGQGSSLPRAVRKRIETMSRLKRDLGR